MKTKLAHNGTLSFMTKLNMVVRLQLLAAKSREAKRLQNLKLRNNREEFALARLINGIRGLADYRVVAPTNLTDVSSSSYQCALVDAHVGTLMLQGESDEWNRFHLLNLIHQAATDALSRIVV